jgi:uncharacterized protein (TIGR02145 family)
MKKIANLYVRTAAMLGTAVVMLFGIALFSSCEDKDNEEPQAPPELTVTPPAISKGEDGGTQVITVAANVDWTVAITAGNDFISVNPAAGTGNGSFTVTVAESNVEEVRAGTITVTGGNITRTIAVEQLAAFIPHLSVEVAEYQNIAATGGILTVTVDANVPWTAISTDPALTGYFAYVWDVLPDYSNAPGPGSYSGVGPGTFQVYAGGNSSLNFRSGTVTVLGTGDGEGLSQAINFSQLATLTFKVSQESLDGIPVAGATFDFVTVTANVDWSVSKPAFVTVNPGSGIGSVSSSNNSEQTVTVTIPANATGSPRNGVITFTGGTLTRTISVSQRGTDPAAVNYVEINGLKWAKYNQSAPGVIPSEVILGPAFPATQATDAACPAGWRLPTIDEWLALSENPGEDGGGSQWGLQVGAFDRQSISSVNGFFMYAGSAAATGTPSIDTHVFVPFVNFENGVTPQGDKVSTFYAVGGGYEHKSILVNPWDEGTTQYYWFGGDNQDRTNTYRRVRCVQD